MKTNTFSILTRDSFPGLLVGALLVGSSPALSQDWWDVQSSFGPAFLQGSACSSFHPGQGDRPSGDEVLANPGEEGIPGFCAQSDRHVSPALSSRKQGAPRYAAVELGSSGQFDARRMQLPRVSGARVKYVHTGFPAATAGLSLGDVIIGLDGTEIGNGRQLPLGPASTAGPAGDVIIGLNGTEIGNGRQLPLGPAPTAGSVGDVILGLNGTDIGNGRQLPLGSASTAGSAGDVILALNGTEIGNGRRLPFGPMTAAGLSAGDVIIGLDGTEIGNGRHLQRLIRQCEPGQLVALSVLRDGEVRSIPMALTADAANGF